MPLEGSYTIWNNRGGTGKTTLTYHLANKYAIKHPDKTVLLIDMCPQADLSHAFLGDDAFGIDYVNQLGTLRRDPMIVYNQKLPKTVTGYLDLYTMQGMVLGNVDPRTFLINVSKLNDQISRNLYLLCGDPSLELMARSLEQKRNQNLTLPQCGQYNLWKSVTTSIKQFIAKIAERKGIKLAVFIDVNSSFSILTEIALTAAEKLIIPITEDHLRRNGIQYMFSLLFGVFPSSAYSYYRHLSFYYRANEYDVKLPKIHLILNKIDNNEHDPNSKMNNNDNNLDWEFIFDLYSKHPQAFNLRNGKLSQLKSVSEFKNEFVIEIFENCATIQTIREAIKCHSPLLSAKNSFKKCSNRLNSSINNLSSASIGSITPKITRATSPQVSRHSSKKHVSYENRTFSIRTYPSQLKKLLNLNKMKTEKNKNIDRESIVLNSFCCASNENLDNSNILSFDKILEKIVDTLSM